MSRHAFFVTGTRAVFVANDAGGTRRFEADELTIPAQLQMPARSHEHETVYFVLAGTFEFMVAGAIGYVSTGNFVRVPAGVTHAYRNADNRLGRLLCRTIPPGGAPASQLTVEVSAA
jgi:mannose-6-phosphate isomerase-like protein (cupin superfamily)